MSCNRNGNKVTASGLKAGISRLSGQFGQAGGRMIDGLARASDRVGGPVGRRVAPLSNRLLRTVDRPAVMVAKVAPALVVAALATRWQLRFSPWGFRPPALGDGQTPRGWMFFEGLQLALGVAVTQRHSLKTLTGLNQLGSMRSRVKRLGFAWALTTSLAEVLARREGGERRLNQTRQGLFFKRKVQVDFRRSRLTPLINRRDLMGANFLGKRIVSSQGEMVRSSPGGLWHRGTTVIKNPQGQERTLTHLQSLRFPAAHYYFDRPLSDQQVAGIVSGQKGFRPHRLPGYVGEVHPTEALAPGWALTKQALIKTRLYWPDEPAGWRTGIN